MAGLLHDVGKMAIPADALRKMAEWQNGHFDEVVFQSFVKTVGIYPTGTLLKLRSGRLGVVTDQTENSFLKPLVKVFFYAGASTHCNGNCGYVTLSRYD